jgi:hypothetical protein
MTLRALMLLVLLALGPAVARAQPSISDVSGTKAHNQTVTITGTGFGSKSPAAPAVWDDSSGSTLSTLWSGGWPSSGDVDSRIQYRAAPYRSMAAPHSRTNRYIVGAHTSDAGFDAGYNVIFWKARTVSSFPAYTYASWYMRYDPNWPSNVDNNKTYDWSVGTSPYTGASYWYSEFRSGENLVSNPACHVIDAGSSFDSDSGDWWGSSFGANPKNSWVKAEHILRHSNSANAGLILLRFNGTTCLDLSTRTDLYAGTQRNDAIGGYANPTGQSNMWRFFTDVYLDYTWARVFRCDESTLATCTNPTMMIPSSWSSTSINALLYGGALSDSGTTYVYVCDANNSCNSSGFAITMSEAGPSPPIRLRFRTADLGIVPLALAAAL